MVLKNLFQIDNYQNMHNFKTFQTIMTHELRKEDMLGNKSNDIQND